MPFSLAADQPAALTEHLHLLGLLDPYDAVTSLSRAGEGNMNLTLRAHLHGGGTLIVKQARGWVEKYPTIPAPAERALVEAAFYRAVQRAPGVGALLPRLLGADADSHLLVLQDLGAASDFLDLYDGALLPEHALAELIGWLQALHALPAPSPLGLLANRQMRALNHLHVFDLPFRPDNGLDLDAVLPGLAAVARALHTDAGLLRRIHALGERYLTDGPTLLHGDFYPGSWLNTERGVRVIDPEFAFCGPASFDWGVLIAHLLLTDQPNARVEAVAARAPQEALGFAGVEVLRRLLGVAQLPLTADLDTRRAWVGRAVAWVFEGTPA